MLRTIWFYYQFHVLRTHVLICAINSSSQCEPSGLSSEVYAIVGTEFALNGLKVSSDLCFPAVGGRVVNRYNLLGKKLTIYIKIYNNIYLKRIYTC